MARYILDSSTIGWWDAALAIYHALCISWGPDTSRPKWTFGAVRSTFKDVCWGNREHRPKEKDVTKLSFSSHFSERCPSALSITGEKPGTADNTWKASGILSKAASWSGAAVIWLFYRPGPGRWLSAQDTTPTRRALPSGEVFDIHGAIAEMLYQILRLADDPPPWLFFLSMLVYGAGMATIYHLNQRSDRFQDLALATGITLAFAAGCILGKDADFIFLRVLPFGALVTLAASAFVNRLWRHRSGCFSREIMTSNDGQPLMEHVPGKQWLSQCS